MPLSLTATVLLARVPGVVFSPWNPHVAAILAIPMPILGLRSRGGLAIGASAARRGRVRRRAEPYRDAAVGRDRSRSRGDRTRDIRRATVENRQANRRRSLRRLVLVCCVEQFLPAGGNISRLLQFALTPQPHDSWSIAIQVWADALLSILSIGLRVPLGLLVTHDPVRWTVAGAVGELLLLAAVAVWARVTGRSPFYMRDRALNCWPRASCRSGPSRGFPDGVHDHEVFWIAWFGALNAGIILACPLALTLSGSMALDLRVRTGCVCCHHRSQPASTNFVS